MNSSITYGYLLDWLRQFWRLLNGWWNLVNTITIATFGLGYWILGFGVLNVLIFLVYKIAGMGADNLASGSRTAQLRVKK